jgi:Type II secretion system (T2SS), protein G
MFMRRAAKYLIVLAVCVVASLFALAYLGKSLGYVKPGDWTEGTMFFTHRRILVYAAKNGHPPARLEDLPNWPGFNNDLRDGWGRQIQYKQLNADIVELTSFGKEGLPGGDGDNEDIVRQFQLHDEKGNWNDPLCEWSNVR